MRFLIDAKPYMVVVAIAACAYCTIAGSYDAPTIYKAPAEDDELVKVLNLDPNTDYVVVTVDGTTEFTATPISGADRYDVPVSGLMMGSTMVARFWVDDTPSEQSSPETNTTNAVNAILWDDCESYSTQEEIETTWVQGSDQVALLGRTANATCPTGSQSALAPSGPAYLRQAIPETTPTPTHPVAWNVNIYDPVGAG